MTFSVVLPTYNEKDHIINLIKTISIIFRKKKLKYEIIVVDDNSIDGTINSLYKFSKKNKFVKLIIRKSKKKNLAKSINEGIAASKHRYIIWMDADFQHPPKYINNLIKQIPSKKVVICSRFLKDSKRYFFKDKKSKHINENQSIFFNYLCRFCLFNEITDYTSGYICIEKKILNNYYLTGYYGDYFLNLITFLKKNKINITEIPFSDKERASGKSKTTESFNSKYIYTCIRYFITFFLNLLNVRFFKFFELIKK